MIKLYTWLALLYSTVALQQGDGVSQAAVRDAGSKDHSSTTDATKTKKEKLIESVSTGFGPFLNTKGSRIEKSWTSKVYGWAEKDMIFSNTETRKSATMVRADIKNCNVTVSDPIALAPGIYCSPGFPVCSLSYTLTESGMFGIKNTVKIGASAKTTLQAGIPLIVDGKVEVGVTLDLTHERHTQNESSTGQTYRFDLKENESCVPSKVQLLLRCHSWPGKYHLQFDVPVTDTSRHGSALYKCRMYDAEEGLLKSPTGEGTWEVLVEDRETEYGKVFTGKAEDVLSKSIIKKWHDEYSKADSPSIHWLPKHNRIILCEPELVDKPDTVDIPLRGPDNLPLGHIGCVIEQWHSSPPLAEGNIKRNWNTAGENA
ncbi:hypothetical protein CCM_09496 [Cordyceps militaris CM01]|uniref:Uncharacterized protein n=1 Tax=Cordyceps militaris (strain CM01) TaxID=983644 RepID=G3JUS3_CORMM|nr:uncharacterized protein CCM_09496 [Cordyceps militaris CM01]EGX87873.1 hypothetical protein CCM_09496 [Cordyceps militaris CM01]